jgi:hypothetical protein
MARLGDWLWEVWAGSAYRLRSTLQRQRRQWWIVDTRPATCIANLAIVAAVQANADRLPCDVTLDEGNILDYTQEIPNDRNLARLSGNAASVWRFFHKGMKRFGDSAELTVGGLAGGCGVRVQMGVVCQTDSVRLCFARSEKPVTAQDMVQPDEFERHAGKP